MRVLVPPGVPVGRPPWGIPWGGLGDLVEPCGNLDLVEPRLGGLAGSGGHRVQGSTRARFLKAGTLTVIRFPRLPPHSIAVVC
jgi:hypothetical protein